MGRLQSVSGTVQLSQSPQSHEAALVLGNHTRSVKDLINLTQNLDLYRFYPDISDDEADSSCTCNEAGGPGGNFFEGNRPEP